MVLGKEKKNKLAIKPSEEIGTTTKRPILDLWADIDRMFEEFKENLDNLFWPLRHRDAAAPYIESRKPPMDVADLGDKYEMHVEIPGIPKNNINIEVTPNSIEISAEHEDTREDKGKNWLRRERSSMRFYRAIELPEELKTDQVEAELKDGLLTITLPKLKPKPKHKAKKIKIK